MFGVGDIIVYGGEGVCRVEAMGTSAIPGADKTKQYYTLSPLYRSGQVLTPVDTRVLMRPVMTRSEAQDLLAALPTLVPEGPEQQNIRAVKEYYQAVIVSYDCSRMASLIKYTCRRRRCALSHGKKVSQLDERYLKRAEDQLYGELAVTLEIPKDAVSDCIKEMYPGWPEE